MAKGDIEYEGNLKFLKQLQQEQERLNHAISSSKDMTEYQKNQEEFILNQKMLQVEQERLLSEAKKATNILTDEEKEDLKKIEDTQKGINREVNREFEARKKVLGVIGFFNNQLKLGWNYLQQSDKVIRSTILNLGMTGVKAEMMRSAFEQSAGFVTRLGGTMEDIQTIMTGYADETGRARTLSAEMVKSIESIGRGTGLDVAQAAKLGAQFELMGLDARASMEYVQGVVDTSERMGVNTTKVLKNISDNFKRLNTYTFQQGTKGLAQMATYAEKFRIDITQALNAADVAKSLEGAVDLAANLQVMGGEFAKSDPFEMLFLSRNDPAKFTEKISDMTRGVVSFRKMADGTFQKFISPADRDRLASVAKSLGMQASEITEIAERRIEIEKMNRDLAGKGLTGREKELIEGAAIFNTQTGKFEVQLAGQMRDISTLTKDQAESFATESVLLQDRAKQAQTFNEVFKATIETLKAALLPILRAINVILKPLASVADFFSNIAGSHLGWAKAGGILITAAAAWKLATFGFRTAIDKFIGGGLGKIFGGGGATGGGGFVDSLGRSNPGAGAARNLAETRRMEAGAGLAKSKGLQGLGMGAGIGVAAVGLGAGVGIAATGISKLADSMSKLTPDQAKNLKDIAMTLAITFPVAAIGIGLVAGAATTGAIGLVALGAAITGVGFGINLATKGIGKMAEGLGTMFSAMKGSGPDIMMAAGGIAGIATAMGAATLTLGGGIGMALAIGAIAKNADKLSTVGGSLEKIKVALTGNKEDFIAIQNAVKSISNLKIRGGGTLSDLAKILQSPLKVEFADKNLTIANDITLSIDGQKLMNKVINVKTIVEKQQRVKGGQEAPIGI